MVVLPEFIKHLVSFIDKFFMKLADAIIIVDPSRLNQIGRKENQGVNIVYNTPPDTSLIISDQIPNKKKDSFIIFFAGILTLGRDFRTMIEVCKTIDNVELVFAGFGICEESLRFVSERESKISFIGRITYDEVIHRSLQADLLFAFYDTSIPNNKYASPNKLFESMMCSKPIIVNDGTAMAEIVRQENCGIVVPYGDKEIIKEGILRLKNDPKLCKILGQNGRNAYERKYNWKIMEQSIIKLYSNLSL
jgi:glycosyltransferase involved in cell wall biosynthesis